MKNLLLRVGLLVALCALPALSAPAQFSDFQTHSWQCGVNNFYGNTLIIVSGTFSNSAALIFNASTLPANTGPLFGWDLTTGVIPSGVCYCGVGALDAFGGVINTVRNGSGGVMRKTGMDTGRTFAERLCCSLNSNGITSSINSITIASGKTLAVAIAAQCMGHTQNYTRLANTGAISEGWLGLAWNGLEFNDYRDFQRGPYSLGENCHAHFNALPIIVPPLGTNRSGTSDILVQFSNKGRSVLGSAWRRLTFDSILP